MKDLVLKTDDESLHVINFALSRQICLILFGIFLIPASLLSLYVFDCIFRMPELRTKMTNQLIIAIFLVSFIQMTCELPFLMRYLNDGRVVFASFSFCKFWIAFNYSLNTWILFLNSYLSIERYLLIFHNNMIQKYKILLHYIPIVGVSTLAVVYSCGTVIFSPCEENFDYGNQLCGGPCFQLDPILGYFDLAFTVFLPLSTIILFNSLLIIRVIYQKRRMLQRNIWKKNIRMLGQLLTVSLLHVTVWIPTVTVLLIVLANPPPSTLIMDLQASYVLINVMYLAIFGNPIVSIIAMPEIKARTDALIRRLNNFIYGGRVEPVLTVTSRNAMTHT